MKKSTHDIRVPELLAPAGSAEGFRAVIAAGADAVYIGGSRFSARAYADNPEEDDLVRLIDYAHLRGVRVYLTVNTLLKDSEMEELYGYMLPLYRAGVDAVLVQDFGVLRFLRRHFPDLPLHASTQMTVTGPESAAWLRDFGVTRIVPARELSLPELLRMKSESGLEVETFIHGALCCSYSGQCLYSSMIGGRSGNRGRCAQPCRLLYLLDCDDFDGSTSIVERKDARHYLSPKDLNGIDLLQELAVAGIDSLKIEGRMKKPEYAAGVVSIYRKYLDRIREGLPASVEPGDRQALYDLYNRSGFTDGYYHRRNGPGMMACVKHELTAAEAETRQRLYGVMRERYIDRERTVPVSVSARVFAGEEIEAVYEASGIGARVSGPPASEARNRALDEKSIGDRLSKTGGTGFTAESADVMTDGKSFVPVKDLNNLRRDGIAALSEAILSRSRRSGEVPPDGSPRGAGAGRGTGAGVSPAGGSSEEKAGMSPPEVAASVSDEAQLCAVLRSPAVSRVYLEASMLCAAGDPAAEAVRLGERTRRAGKSVSIAFPYIDRGESSTRKLKEAAEELIRGGFSSFLVRSPETCAWFVRRGMAGHLTADAGLYTFNSEAQAFLRESGVLSDTAPFELNRKELFRRDNSLSEIVVYGYIPLMVTVQCLSKNTDRCRRKNDRFVLTDRMGMKFPVKCDCVFCYNIVRNSLPLMLLGELDSIRRMGFPGIRLMFTDEDAGETAAVLRTAEEALRGNPPAGGDRWTKGHFLRGVE